MDSSMSIESSRWAGGELRGSDGELALEAATDLVRRALFSSLSVEVGRISWPRNILNRL